MLSSTGLVSGALQYIVYVHALRMLWSGELKLKFALGSTIRVGRARVRYTVSNTLVQEQTYRVSILLNIKRISSNETPLRNIDNVVAIAPRRWHVKRVPHLPMVTLTLAGGWRNVYDIDTRT